MKTILSFATALIFMNCLSAQSKETVQIQLGISAEVINSEIAVYWTNSESHSIRYYELEKLNPEQEWVGLIYERPMVDQLTFKAADTSPVAGLNTYRIKAKTKEGKFFYTKPVDVYFEPLSFDVMIYPNPANAWLVVSSDKDYVGFTSVLKDQYGNEVIKEESVDGTCVLNTQEIIEGLYYLSVEGPGAKYKQTVVVNHR